MGKTKLNSTELMSGKDGMLSIEVDGVMTDLAEIENFTTNMDVASVDKQPVGDIVVHSVPTGVIFNLTFTEMVVRDDVVLEPLLNAIANGKIPVWHFQGKMDKPDGTEQRIAYNDCVPSGSFGLQNITPGEVVTRENNFRINKVPNIIKALASKYL